MKISSLTQMVTLMMLAWLSVAPVQSKSPLFNTMRQWHNQLTSTTLQSVDLDGTSIVKAWNQLNQKYLVRSILISTSGGAAENPNALPIRLNNVLVPQIYDRLCNEFNYTWTKDDSTGIVWIYPSDYNFSSFTSIPLNPYKCGENLGLLENILDPAVKNGYIQIPFFIYGDVWVGTFNNPVDIQPESCTLKKILDDVCMSCLSKTFYIDLSALPCRVSPVNLGAGPHVDPRPGEQLYCWQNFHSSIPDNYKVIEFLSSDDDVKIEIAHQYLATRGWNVHFSKLLSDCKTEVQKVHTGIAISRLVCKDSGASVPDYVLSALNKAVDDADFIKEDPEARTRAALELFRLGKPQSVEALLNTPDLSQKLVRHRRDTVIAMRGLADMRGALQKKEPTSSPNALLQKLKSSSDKHTALYKTLSQSIDLTAGCLCDK